MREFAGRESEIMERLAAATNQDVDPAASAAPDSAAGNPALLFDDVSQCSSIDNISFSLSNYAAFLQVLQLLDTNMLCWRAQGRDLSRAPKSRAARAKARAPPRWQDGREPPA